MRLNILQVFLGTCSQLVNIHLFSGWTIVSGISGWNTGEIITVDHSLCLHPKLDTNLSRQYTEIKHASIANSFLLSLIEGNNCHLMRPLYLPLECGQEMKKGELGIRILEILIDLQVSSSLTIISVACAKLASHIPSVGQLQFLLLGGHPVSLLVT